MTRSCPSRSLSAEDLAALFGTTADDLPPESLAVLESSDLTYDLPSSEELAAIVVGEMDRIDSSEPVALAERSGQFEEIWAANLRAFTESHDPEALIPAHWEPPEFARLEQRYVIPRDPAFLRKVYTAYRSWVFKRFLHDVDAVYELGCGSCDNLALLARLYPDKQLFGFDVTKSAVGITEELARAGVRIEGGMFDLARPDPGRRLVPRSALVTVAAMEVVGTRYEAFVDWALEQGPVRCVHLEPISEFYDRTKLADALAWKLDRKNGFLRGFYSFLKHREALGQLRIETARRAAFGDVHDAWSLVVWSPGG